jgi:hypothetical protein
VNYENFHIYVVEGEAQLQAVADFKRERQEAHNRRIAWCKTQGGIGAVQNGYSMVGLLADSADGVVEGWKPANKRDWSFPPRLAFVPDLRRKIGKAVDKMMRSLSIPDGKALARLLGCDASTVKFADGALRWFDSCAYDEGEHVIVLAPQIEDEDPPTLPGCRRLKLSEFYALKELSTVTA